MRKTAHEFPFWLPPTQSLNEFSQFRKNKTVLAAALNGICDYHELLAGNVALNEQIASIMLETLQLAPEIIETMMQIDSVYRATITGIEQQLTMVVNDYYVYYSRNRLLYKTISTYINKRLRAKKWVESWAIMVRNADTCGVDCQTHGKIYVYGKDRY